MLFRSSSIELSADGPIKPPYSVFFQGGLTWQHAKFGILKSLQTIVNSNVVSAENVELAYKKLRKSTK